MFDATCSSPLAADLGYSYTNGTMGRSRVEGTRLSAPPGSFYWWNGQSQYFPNVDYQTNALRIRPDLLLRLHHRRPVG